jgi:hypothetical protein
MLISTPRRRGAAPAGSLLRVPLCMRHARHLPQRAHATAYVRQDTLRM